MRFYFAFMIPSPGTKTPVLTYDINGIGFEFTNSSLQEVKPEALSLKLNGVEKLRVNDIVVQTERITRRGVLSIFL